MSRVDSHVCVDFMAQLFQNYNLKLTLRTFCLSFTVLTLRRLNDPLLQIANAISFKTIVAPSWAMPETPRQIVRKVS